MLICVHALSTHALLRLTIFTAEGKVSNDPMMSCAQAALDRSKSELALQRDKYDKVVLDVKRAEAAQARAESDYLAAKKKLDEALKKSNKSGQLWEEMMQGKQTREVEVNSLREQVTKVETQRDQLEIQVATLKQQLDDLEAEKSRAYKRVQLCSSDLS